MAPIEVMLRMLPGALPNHLLVHRLSNGEQAADIGADDFVPGAISRGREIIAAIDGRIVDEDIYAAPILHQLARQMLQPEAISHGSLKRTRPPAEGLNDAHHLFCQVIS